MISGDKLYDAVQFVDAIYKDISRLIGAVDGGMRSIDYVSLWGPRAFGLSKAVDYASAWMPHSFTRVYVPKQERETFSAFAFLNIYLTPKHFREPLLHWGVGRRKNGADIGPVWTSRLTVAQGPSFLKASDIDPFESSGELSAVLEVFRHAASPLIRMDTAEALERMVLAPIRSEVVRLPPPVTAEVPLVTNGVGGEHSR
jgi:hypothetical protein